MDNYDKSLFTRTSLKQVCQAVDPYIEEVEYVAHNANETVVVTYKNGYTRRVNVMGDNLKGIACDVLEAL